MGNRFILEIQAAYNQLTKTEKKVADYIMNNQNEVLYMSITDLADACEVGDTSVYRFCRTMNLQGYQEFKMKLSLGQNLQHSSNIDYKKNNASTAEKVMDANIKSIKETFLMLDNTAIDKAISLFESSGKVYFLGVGDSLLTTQAACNRFLRITNKVSCLTDSHIQAMCASTANKDDLFIIISYSGATKDNILVAKLAKESGAKVICITHYRKSPITQYVDIVLLSGSEEAPLEGGAVTSKIGTLYLLDLLYQEYYSRNYKESRINNEKTSRAVLDKLF